MHRVSGTTLGAVGVGLLAVFLVAGFAFASVPFAASAHSGSSAASGGAPAPAAGRTYAPVVSLGFLNPLSPNASCWGGVYASCAADEFTFTPLPYNLSIWSNISWGTFSSTYTTLSVAITYGSPATTFATLSGTITASDVVVSDINGVVFSNYTWTVSLDQTTLGCTTVSCGDLIPTDTPVMTFNATLSEAAGAGTSYSWSASSSYATVATALVSTFTSVAFTSPALITNPSDLNYGLADVPVGTTVQFTTNTSWGYTSNATMDLTLVIQDATTGTVLGSISFNGTVNTTTLTTAGIYLSSASVFNGTLSGTVYTAATWQVTLNETNLAAAGFTCINPSCSTASFASGEEVNLSVLVLDLGSSAGGYDYAANTVAMAGLGLEVGILGTTIIDGSVTALPGPYQGLPFTWTGTLWISWAASDLNTLAPGSATDTSPGNLSIAGTEFELLPAGSATPFATLSASNSVNTTNAYGVSLMPVANATYQVNLTSPSLIIVPYNYTEYDVSVTLNSSLSGWTSTLVPYIPMYLNTTIDANGNASGSWGVASTVSSSIILPTTFTNDPTTLSVAITNKIPAYVPSLPFTVNYTLTVTNAPIDPTTTTLYVQLIDLVSGAVRSNTSVTPANGQTSYQFVVDSSTLACITPSCTELPAHSYEVLITASVNGILGTTNGTLATATDSSPSFFVVAAPVSIALVSPSPGTSVPVGTVTVSVAYSGSYITTANITIKNSGGLTVFTHLMIETGTGYFPPNATWFASSPGTYTYSIIVETVYAPALHYSNGTISVYSQSKAVYHNASTIPGLSGAAAGTLLLLVGLIIGMIVAFVLGRAVWGGKAATSPPQAWEAKSGETPPAATNTCSVCGKSFSTPEELAAHGKAEHGMQ